MAKHPWDPKQKHLTSVSFGWKSTISSRLVAKGTESDVLIRLGGWGFEDGTLLSMVPQVGQRDGSICID